MTCIVGLRTATGIVMGADSMANNGYRKLTLSTPKVFRNGEFLIGFTGTIRMGQLLRYALKPPRQGDEDVMQYLVTTWVDAVRETFKDGGFARKENEVERGGYFLLGYRGRLFQVEGNYQVTESQEPFNATGSGEEYALGSLHATEGRPPIDRVRIALEAAARFNPYVAPPYRVIFSGDPA